MSTLRNCPKCNNNIIDDNAKFCTECGARLDSQTADGLQAKFSADTVNIKKGHKVALTAKKNPPAKIVVEMGWNKDAQHKNFDIDAAIFLLDDNGKLSQDGNFVFYSNPEHASGAVEYVGKFLIDDTEVEKIRVDLEKIPDAVSKIAFTCTINDADKRGQNFAQVKGLLMRIIDESNSTALIQYDQDRDFSIETALVMGELYRYKGAWKFNAILAGFKGGLPALCKNFGVKI